MKITDHEVIKTSEQELIDAITADLDWGTIDEIIRREHNLDIEENVEYKKGDIVVHNDQVAYKLDFNVNVILSVLLDREGNYISVSSSGGLSASPDEKDHDLQYEPNGQYEAALAEFDSAGTDDNDVLPSLKITEDVFPEEIPETTSGTEKIISAMENEKETATEMV